MTQVSGLASSNLGPCELEAEVETCEIEPCELYVEALKGIADEVHM